MTRTNRDVVAVGRTGLGAYCVRASATPVTRTRPGPPCVGLHLCGGHAPCLLTHPYHPPCSLSRRTDPKGPHMERIVRRVCGEGSGTHNPLAGMPREVVACASRMQPWIEHPTWRPPVGFVGFARRRDGSSGCFSSGGGRVRLGGAPQGAQPVHAGCGWRKNYHYDYDNDHDCDYGYAL